LYVFYNSHDLHPQVIEITVNEIDDRDAMVRHFKKLAKYLSGRDLARELSDNTEWFQKE